MPNPHTAQLFVEQLPDAARQIRVETIQQIRNYLRQYQFKSQAEVDRFLSYVGNCVELNCVVEVPRRG